MKKSDLQVYFYTLRKRFDNMLCDPKIQWSDYQRLASDALVVLGKIVDEWPDNEQEYFKAYHNGYDQGRFDEQAEQWLKANSQKAETKQWKSCPYCRSKDPDANAEIYKNGDEYLAIGSDGNVEIDEGNLVMEENYYLYQEKLFKFCPMCGRPLNEEEE